MASAAMAELENLLGDTAKSASAQQRADNISKTIEAEYYDPDKLCYAFSRNANGSQDRTSTVYPALAWWSELSNGRSVLAHPEGCLQQLAAHTLATDWGLRDVSSDEKIYDGMSYHQGSVWPLFTGWAALAEYRANQPLAGEQMLMQNVDLTWAQDPGSVTELLSGDFFVPFGRSTSHQLWSSAMVITPTLRGLFGISLDAATNTITVNPHLPAQWTFSHLTNLHIGGQTFNLHIQRLGGAIHVSADTAGMKAVAINMRSDVVGAKLPTIGGRFKELIIPLPEVEVSPPAHFLPMPGSRTTQPKILSTAYGNRSLKVLVQGEAGTTTNLMLWRNKAVDPKVVLNAPENHPGAKVALNMADPEISFDPAYPIRPIDLDLHFPQGQGWQTLEFTLTW